MKHSVDDIAKELQRNPDNGFRMLVASFTQPVYNHVRRLVTVHADAEDITQETFIKAYRSIGNLREAGSLPAWMMRIATNEALRHLQRDNRLSVPIDSPEANEAQSLAADEYFDYTDIEAVRLQEAIKTLPPKQQAAFNLRYYDDMSYEEIASVMETSPQNAKVNYHIAKKKIIDIMTAGE